MAGPTTEVLNDELKDLRADVHRIDVGLAELRAEIRLAVGFAKWATGLIGGTILMGVLSGVGWGVSINAQVQAIRGEMTPLRIDVDKIRIDVDKLRVDQDKLRVDVDKIKAAVLPAEAPKVAR